MVPDLVPVAVPSNPTGGTGFNLWETRCLLRTVLAAARRSLRTDHPAAPEQWRCRVGKCPNGLQMIEWPWPPYQIISSRRRNGGVGELVGRTDGSWMTRPPQSCPRGHSLSKYGYGVADYARPPSGIATALETSCPALSKEQCCVPPFRHHDLPHTTTASLRCTGRCCVYTDR
jgi:hypothetical protein